MKATRREVVERTIVLELSEVEAQFLYDLAQRIGGDSHSTRRRHADATYGALAGYVDIGREISDMAGTIILSTEKETIS